jgi:uncharacterized protein (DUF1810 family)
MDDPHNLQRFIDAQDRIYDRVLAELRAGSKSSHWMWFVFPQIAGLGLSSMAQRYAIRDCREAEAYIAHPLLGPRLRECTALVNAVEGKSAHEIFGSPDDMKFRSSMTLFRHCSDEPLLFEEALQKLFNGKDDPLTTAKL